MLQRSCGKVNKQTKTTVGKDILSYQIVMAMKGITDTTLEKGNYIESQVSLITENKKFN